VIASSTRLIDSQRIARWIRVAFSAVGALLLAWQVVKTSAVDALVRRSPGTAFMVSPNHPRVRIALAMAEFQAKHGRLSLTARVGAMDALRGAPLTEEPFYLAAVDALATGREADGERLLLEARRRDPRARAARLILLDRYLRTKRMAEAGVEIAALNRLMPRAGEVLVPELARMVGDPQTGAALVRVLAQEPVLQQAVLESLASVADDPALILKIAATTKTKAGRAEGLPWQRALLKKLIERGNLRQAHSLWRSFTGLPSSADGKGLYDGNFQGAPGAPPFNWQFTANAAGVAERIKEGALQIDFFGRDNVELAAQLLLLKPGVYRLQFGAEGNAGGNGSRLIWTVSCSGSKAQLLSLPISEITYKARTFGVTFNVPNGCSGQWLKLTGLAGEFPKAQTVLIKEVKVVPGATT
jgi:hypothetical protein